jgi:hypothetical protein
MRSLRHAIIGVRPLELQLPEQSLTGSAAIRGSWLRLLNDD